MAIGDIKIGNRFRKDVGDIAALAASMKDIGLLQPIVVTPNLQLVAGARRTAAAGKLGWATIPAIIAANLTEAIDLLRAERRDENTCREAFTPEEAVALGKAIEAAVPARGRRESGAARAREEGRSSEKNRWEKFAQRFQAQAGRIRPDHRQGRGGGWNVQTDLRKG